MNQKLINAQFVKRGDDVHSSEDIPEEYCGGLCKWGKLINEGSPNCHYYCHKLNIEVECYDSCKYYLSIFDADPNLLKPFANTTSETTTKVANKRKGWLFNFLKK